MEIIYCPICYTETFFLWFINGEIGCELTNGDGECFFKGKLKDWNNDVDVVFLNDDVDLFVFECVDFMEDEYTVILKYESIPNCDWKKAHLQIYRKKDNVLFWDMIGEEIPYWK